MGDTRRLAGVSLYDYMKLSIYNSIIPIASRHTLLYNSLSGKFIIVKNRIITLSDLESANFKYDFPSLYGQMIEGRFFIDKHENEVYLLQNIIDKADDNKEEYILHINPTLDCNFRCWYCYENHTKNSRMSSDILESTLTYVQAILKEPSIKSFELGFFGGEPLLYFNSISKKIISDVKSYCDASGVAFHVHFTSNGALINDNIIKFLSKMPCGFQITLDGGKTDHDKTRYFNNNAGSYDLITRNILRLISSGIDVIVRINYTSRNIGGLDSLLETFKNVDDNGKKHLKFDFQRVWQDKTDMNDTTETIIREIRRKFVQNNFIVLHNFIPHNVRDSCYGDKINHALINYNGDVYGCTARDFTKTNRIGTLDESGKIIYDSELLKKRNSSKLAKAVCRKCRIAPICGGGCKQRAMESLESDECTFKYNDEDIDGIIMDIFEYSQNIIEE